MFDINNKIIEYVSQVYGHNVEGLDADTKTTNKNDPSMEIVTALASIRDETVKSRIVTFIEDVAGVTVARQN